MKEHEQILQQAHEYILALYKERENKLTPYHTIERVEDLVKKTQKIAKKSDLEERDSFHASLAAYFIYTPYWQKSERLEVQIAETIDTFNKTLEDSFDIESVKALIRSVTEDKEDKALVEQVFYDAYHHLFGSKKLASLLELKALEQGEESPINEFRRTNEFLSHHKFRTTYAIEKFTKRKAKNSAKLLNAIQKEEAKEVKAKLKSRKLGRGIETMYRTVYRNHINLSSIADEKANLIIRVNTIILSIIITLGGTGYTFFEEGFFKYSRFTVPVMVFVAGSLAAVIFAILSARPKVTNKEVSKKRLLGKESSILFFGNFTAMDKKDFVREMALFRQNNDRVYDSMSVDLYYLGLVLDKKYRLVKYAYNTFMIGLTLSVVSFMTIFMLFQFSQ